MHSSNYTWKKPPHIHTYIHTYIQLLDFILQRGVINRRAEVRNAILLAVITPIHTVHQRNTIHTYIHTSCFRIGEESDRQLWPGAAQDFAGHLTHCARPEAAHIVFLEPKCRHFFERKQKSRYVCMYVCV
jgi:hypothetical protein